MSQQMAYRANAARPQPTQQLSDTSAGPAVYAAERHQPNRLCHLLNVSEAAPATALLPFRPLSVFDFQHRVSY